MTIDFRWAVAATLLASAATAVVTALVMDSGWPPFANLRTEGASSAPAGSQTTAATDQAGVLEDLPRTAAGRVQIIR